MSLMDLSVVDAGDRVFVMYPLDHFSGLADLYHQRRRLHADERTDHLEQRGCREADLTEGVRDAGRRNAMLRPCVDDS